MAEDGLSFLLWGRFRLIGSEDGFSGLRLHWRPREVVQCLQQLQLPLQIKLQPQIFIHKRMRGAAHLG